MEGPKYQSQSPNSFTHWCDNYHSQKLTELPVGPSDPYNRPHTIFILRNRPQWARASSFARFLDLTRCTTVGRTLLDERSARRRDLYRTQNTYNKQISMPPVEFEPTVSGGEWPQTYALDCAATGTGPNIKLCNLYPGGTALYSGEGEFISL
jgi:hypothetical protein